MNNIVFNDDGSAALTIAAENAESFKDFKTDGDLSNFIKAAAGKITPLGENPTEQEIAAFNKALGVPDTPEGYGFTFKDEQQAALFKQNIEDLQKAGVPKRAAENLMTAWKNQIEAKKAEIDKVYGESEKQLSAEWKENKENNKLAALKAAALLGFDKDQIAAMEQIIGPLKTWTAFYNLSLKMKDTPLKGGGTTMPNFATKEEADKKIDELLKDQAFKDKLIKGDPEAKKLWDNLNSVSSGVKL